MSLALALKTGDLTELPGRRDEAWRWTDLRALLRVLPPPSPEVDTVAANAALAALKAPVIVYANGRALEDNEVCIPATGKGIFIRRFVSATAETSHHLEAPAEVGEGGQLILIDSFEGQAGGYVADTRSVIRLAPGATLERIVLLDDAADAVSISLTEVGSS